MAKVLNRHMCAGLLFLAVFLLPAREILAFQPKYLVKGISETMTTDYEIGDVAVSDPTVLDFMVQKGRNEIFLNPLKAGVATLTIWDSGGSKRDSLPVTVGLTSVEDVVKEIKNIFSNNNKVRFQQDGDRILIEGEASTPEELTKVEELSRRFQQIVPRLTLAAGAIEKQSQKIEAAIAIPGIKARYIKGRLVLEGLAYGRDAAQKAESVAKLFEPNLLNLIEVREEAGRRPGRDKLVQLDIYFLEIKRSAMRGFGIQWAPGAVPKDDSGSDGGAGLTGLGRSLIGFVFNLIPKVRFMREHGDARILESPSFIVKSGEAVDFFSGTQVPYMSGDTVTFKEVGIKVDAQPIVAGSDVDIKITTAVSSMSAGVDKGIDTNKLSTTAYLKAGQSLVLGGILRNNDAKQINKVPSDLNTSSALIQLFLSKDYQSNRSEFLVFVTPTIVDEAESASESMVEWYKMNDEITKKRSKKEDGKTLLNRKERSEVAAKESSYKIEVPAALKERPRKHR